MKKTIFILFITVGLYACNSSCEKKSDTADSSTEVALKDHVCTAACEGGSCVYAHGEKGHVCNTECQKVENRDMELKDHVCTSACKPGACVMAHGEKGHVCDEKCS